MPLKEYFQEFDRDEKYQNITIKNLLTMSSGLHWPGNSAMIPSKNWVNFVLNQKMKDSTKTQMVYSCGSSHLLSAILQKTTGLNASAFAEKHLFTPLGITDYRWNSDAQGITIGGFGLNLKTMDMLKIGELYLNKGMWRSKQILPLNWIEESTHPNIKADHQYSYAYHWWTTTFDNQMGRTFFLPMDLKVNILLLLLNIN